MAKGKAQQETWEIDPSTWTLNDLIEFQEAAKALSEPGNTVEKFRVLRGVLARIVVNKSEEEIGQVPLVELSARMAQITRAMAEYIQIPKANTTP